MLIIKDKDEKNVTRGAYEQIYKSLGYKPIVVIDVKPIEEKPAMVKPIEENKEEIRKEPVSQKNTPKKIKK